MIEMQKKPGAHSIKILLIALILALINGLLYVFLVPPWQHYDEPNHFEVAWWYANYRKPLQVDDYDQEMRRQVLTSMIDHDFFKGMGGVPDVNASDGPVWIGKYKQHDEPFLYYVTVAVPLYLLRGQDMDIQLYAARLVSLFWLLVTVACGYGVVVQLTAPGNPMRWMLPISMALLPGFVDLMTAVNNDVGAIAASSFALFVSVRLLRGGLQPLWLVVAGVMIFVCGFMKETAYPAAIILLLAAILAGFVKTKYRLVGWSIIGLGALLLLIGGFSWGDAANWYRLTYQASNTRSTAVDKAPLGEAVFRLEGGELEGSVWLNRLQQLITAEDIASLKGQTVTLGAWLWAEREGEKIRLSLTALMPDESAMQGSETFVVGSEPAFYAFQAEMPMEAAQSWVTVTAEGYGTIYLDGIVLAMGSYPLNLAPEPADAENETGVWGGNNFVNILRGSSAEQSWPRVQVWVDRIGSKILPDQGRPSLVIYSLFDRQAGGWYYETTLRSMQQTFWGKFGWGHIPLQFNWAYDLLKIVSILGIAGLILGGLTKGSAKIPWDALILMALMMLLVWGLAVARGSFYLFSWRFIPSSRYGFPAIIPTVGFLCLGWWKLGWWLKDFMWTHYIRRVPAWLGLIGYWLFVVGLNCLAIFTVYQYYYG